MRYRRESKPLLTHATSPARPRYSDSSPVRNGRPKNDDIAFVRSCLGLTEGHYFLPPIFTGRTKDVIFISIDTERDAKGTTELGITLLDTRDIQGIPPGRKALNWCPYFRPHHFGLKPTQSFLFGTSNPLPKSGLNSYISSLLGPERNCILVGHSLSGDLDRLSKLTGTNLRNLPNVSATIDTHALVRADKRVPQTLSGLWQHLSAPASEILGFLSPTAARASTGFRFHNAGNDAVYNLHALLLLAVVPQWAWAPAQNVAGVQAVVKCLRAFVTWALESRGRELEVLPVGAMLRRPKGLALRQPRQGVEGVTLRFSRQAVDGGS